MNKSPQPLTVELDAGAFSPKHQAARNMAEKGLPVFPLHPNAKTPRTSSGYKDATTDVNQIDAWWSLWPDANIGMATEGFLVLDVDCKGAADGYATLMELEAQHGPLPSTLTQATPSGGKHYIYTAAGISCRTGCPGPGIDIRGNGGYIVVAPSNINGVAYQISDDQIVPAPEWLVALAKKPLLSIVKPSAVTEGSRNNHIFQLALQSKNDGLTKEQALENALTDNKICVPPLEEAEITKTVDSAYRYASGKKSDADIALINEKHAVVNVGGKCRVMTQIIDPDTGLPDIQLSSPADFKIFYGNVFVQVENNKIPLGQFWLSHPKRNSYAGIVFNPVTTPHGYFNLWTGFAVKPKAGSCRLFLEHIHDNIANSNEAVYVYIIAWMAQTVQAPADRPGVALVMRGSMGTGKGVFANGFGGLFGNHYMPLSQGSQLTGKFNSHMKSLILLFADESFWAGDKSAEGVLKAMITEPFLIIEGKGENAFKISNHLHFMFATNNEWCVPAGPQERRFFVIDVGEKRMQDHEYFAAIQHELDHGGREALLHYLLHYDLTGVNLRKFPQTAALMEQKVHSMTPIQKFWYSKLLAGSLSLKSDWETEVPTKGLYMDFIRFAGDLGVRHKPSDAEFGTQLKKLVSGITTGKGRASMYGSQRPNVYRVPPLDECRAEFCKFVNYAVEWPVCEAATTTHQDSEVTDSASAV